VSIPHPQDSDPWSKIAQNSLYQTTHPLFEKLFSPPATSAQVERIFSRSGLLMRPNRARMGDTLLSQLVFLRCNNDVLYADSMSVCCLHVLTLTVAVCEDILMLSTYLALNKMHYSVLPRHLPYSILNRLLMSCYCSVMFDLALALVLALSIWIFVLRQGFGLELLSLESIPVW